LLFLSALIMETGRDGRAVECGGLENRCSPYGEPGVRIPLSPQRQSKPSRLFCRDGFLFSDWPFKTCFDKD
jgi:hypothetical protein